MEKTKDKSRKWQLAWLAEGNSINTFFYFLFFKGGEKMEGYKSPLFIDFDVTLACNLRCAHCNVDAGAPLTNEMSCEEIKTLLTEMFDIGVYDLALTGGEPLTRKDWRELVIHTHQYPAWKLTLNTNGVLWTEEDVQFMVENAPHFLVAVSVDGPTAETYGILRRTAAGTPAVKEFEKVMHTIHLLKEYGAKYDINYTITKKNIEYFFDMVHVVAELEGQLLGLKFFPYGRGKININELELDYNTWATFLREATRLKEEDSTFEKVVMSTPCPWEMYVPLLTDGYTDEDVKRIWGFETPLKNDYYRMMRDIGCNAGVTSCALSPDGSVYPCGTVSAKIPPLYCGNIREGGLLHVWQNSPFLKKLRELKLSQIEGHCPECEFKELCGGGCRARALIHGGGLTAHDPLCPLNQKR
ncbi:MAG: hypothetical protein AYK19_06390 [Theionarchaea archaeon DG-70-1]|nr:MAG: hypothetical protein AYK19_06390 [Theionarchaea archaeon DG-70-1]